MIINITELNVWLNSNPNTFDLIAYDDDIPMLDFMSSCFHSLPIVGDSAEALEYTDFTPDPFYNLGDFTVRHMRGMHTLEHDLRTAGFRMTSTHITLPPTALHFLTNFCDSVMAEYDSDEGDRATPTWDHYALSGDDSVDYYGSHISLGIEIITAFAAR